MPGAEALIEFKDLRPDELQLLVEQQQTQASRVRHTRIIWIGDDIQQLFHAVAVKRRDNPKLGEMGAYRIDNCGSLPDQKMPRSVEDKTSLLLDRFDRHEAHARPLHCFTNRLGVGRVVLLPLHVWLYIGRRYQFHGVTERRQLARPVVRRRACLYADRARCELGEERDHHRTLQLLAHDNLAARINRRAPGKPTWRCRGQWS